MREIGKDIIEKAAEGDMSAFEEIYRAFSSTVYTIAANVTRNNEDAEEVTQDVFVKVARKLPEFKFESSFGTWIYRITMNAAINAYKTRARQRQKTAAIDEVGDIADPGSGAARDEIDRQGAAAKIARLLGSLNQDQRACIVLREIEGLDYKEIAEVLKIPLNTVRTRIKRAREALVAHCKSEGLGYGL